MNQNKKRGISILLLIVLILTIQSAFAYEYGCCYHPDNFCQNVETAQECCGEETCPPSIFEANTPCSETKCEWQGCCHQTCTMTQYKDCNYGFTPIAELAPTYTCDSAPECSQGCCLYMTQENQIGLCEIATQQQCQPDTFYPNVQFYTGLTTEECNALCNQNITTTGSLEGYVFNQETNQPIQEAKVIAAGLTQFTDDDGYYYFDELSQGQITIVASHENYISETQTKTIQADQTNFLDFFLEEKQITGGTLTGQLKNQDEQGIFGFVYYSEQGTFTDSNGYFTINNIQPGNIEITAMSNYYIPKTEFIEILPDINTYNFILESEEPDELCGNSIINFGEECEQDNDQACPGLCTNCQCPDTCSEAGGDCYIFPSQCSEANGEPITIDNTELCSGFSYQGSSSGCCNQNPINIPPCIDGTLNNQPVSGTEHPENINLCICGNQYINLSKEQAQGYCCDGEYHTQAQTCELAATLSGYTLSLQVNEDSLTSESLENNILPEVDLTLIQTFTNNTFTTTSFENGYYLINLPKGNYSLLAEKEHYNPATQLISLSSAENKELNITLQKHPFICSPSNITKPSLSADQTRGLNQITLTWQQECLDYIDHFEIYRDDQLIYTTLDSSKSSYTDKSTEWDKTYSYKVKAVTFSTEQESNIVSISPGSSQCEDKFEDESWCFDNTKRVVCDENNQPVLWDGYQRGSENGDCTKAVGNGSICMSEDGESWCTQAEDCSDTGISNFNIFGLFYNLAYPEKSCLYRDIQSADPKKRYCYYDSFGTDQDWTTVDKCLSCSPELTCFDYNTESACLEDNCLISQKTQNKCQWYTSYNNYEILGKGYCAPENYTDTDHCQDCSPDSELFLNTQCTQDICSNLGRCYSSENNSACLECTEETTCESYNDQDSCIGANSEKFNIPGNCPSSYNIQYSNDNCNLGRCIWRNDQCIKDGNADSKDDCNGNIDCLKDNSAPITEIAEIPNYINKQGATILFDTIDNTNIEETYYCIGKNCCPRNKAKNSTIFLHYTHNLIGEVDKFINISYYSIDKNKNIEEIQTNALYSDTKDPEVNLFYYIQNSTNQTKTDLFINFSLSEKSICSGRLIPKEESFSDTLIESSKEINYTGLGDGQYLFTIKCSDLHQNTIAKNYTIEIDRFHKIYDPLPNLQTLRTNNVTISVKTEKDQLYCYYSEINQTKQTLNPETSGLGIEYGQDYIYQKQLTNLQSDSYNYNISCYETPGQQPRDSTFISFTIDYLPPNTEILMLNPNGRYYPPEQKPYPLLNFKFNCQDTNQKGVGPSGCKLTKFCITENSTNCTPDLTYSEPQTINTESGTKTICYYSQDNLGNNESIKCTNIIIDKSSPTLEIVNPDMLLTTNSNITVNGNFYDTTNIDVFIKTRNSQNQISDSVQAQTTFTESSESGTFNADINLFEGYNQITATAYDRSGHQTKDSVIIYYDNQGPGIKEIIIEDQSPFNDPDTDYILEYGSDISFNAKVNDYLYSDIYEEYKKDVSSVSLKLSEINNQTIVEKDFIYNNITDSYTFEYSLQKYPQLAEGDYKAEIIMQDQFGHISKAPYILKIRDTIGYQLSILNHENKNIIDTENKAESGYPITLSFDTPKTKNIETAQITITHNNPAEYNKKITLINQTAKFQYPIYDYLPEGQYTLHYILTDARQKTYQDTILFDVQDTLAPAFNITIKKDNQTKTAVTYGIYNVYIEPFEPVYDIESLKYSFNGKQDTVKDIFGMGKKWQGKLHISLSEKYQNIEDANAQFDIVAKDYNEQTGGNILFGREFTINTKGPEAPYLFTPKQKIIEKKQPSLYVSGHTPDWNPENNIVFKVNQVSSDLIAPGWSKLKEITPKKEQNKIAEWKTSLYGEIQLIEQNKIRLNDPEYLLRPDRFIDFTTEKTSNMLYRKIISSNLYSDPDGEAIYYEVTFSPALDKNISSYQGQKTLENIQIYSTKYPVGWFDTTLTLSEGINYLVAQTKDSSGNYGEHSEIYQITYDNTNPVIDMLEPMPDSYTNQEKPVIKAKIKDTGAGLSKEKINLSIYKENYTLSCGQSFCNPEDSQQCSTLNCFMSQDKKNINISYLSPATYLPGWKDINIVAKDKAGNTAEQSWGFWLDGKTPSRPEINLTPGNRIKESSPYKYYTNTQKPNLQLEFLPFETIELTDYYIKDQENNKIENSITLTKLTPNTFSGQITKDIQEKPYKIYLEAKKQFPNGSWSKNAHWNFEFELDQTKPEINAEMPQKTNGQDSIANITYTEKNPYYIELSQEATGKITQLSSPMQHLIELTESQGEKEISFTLYDKAGNIATTNAKTYFDSIGPEISDNYQNHNKWVSEPQTVTISATDLHGIKEVLYCDVTGCNPFTEGQRLNHPYKIDFEEEQATNISYGAYDTFDNPSNIKNFRVLYDITNPELSLFIAPQSNRQETIISGKIIDQNPHKIEFTGDLTKTTYYPENSKQTFNHQINLTPEQGQKTIIAKAYDYAGNTIEKTTSTILNPDSEPLSISYIEGAFNVEDYFKSSKDELTIHGYHLFPEDVSIYPKNNPSNLAETTANTFTLKINNLDGYMGEENAEKPNLITLVAYSPGSEKYEKQIRIIKDDQAPKITLIEPSTQYTNSENPQIIIETDEPSYCSLKTESKKDMQTEDNIIHNQQLSNVELSVPVNVTCSDLSGKSSSLSFELKIDKTQPYIYHTKLTGAKQVEKSGTQYSFLLFVSPETSIESFANEPVICKQGQTTEYGDMTQFKKSQDFSSEQISEKITLENGQYTKYIICKDRADNPSKPVKLDITVNTELPIQISEIKPEQYTNKKNPELSFYTYRNSTCTASTLEGNAVSFDYSDNEYSEESTLNQKRLNQKIKHTTTISEKGGPLELISLKDNTDYAFEINCQSNIQDVKDSETKTVYFTTDFTSPLISVEAPSNGAKVFSSYLEINAQTEENSNYTLSVNNNQQTYSTKTPNGKINDFVILEDGVNKIDIEVIDKAGNTAKSQLFIRYNSQGPKIGFTTPSNKEVLPPQERIIAQILDGAPSPKDTQMKLFIFDKQQTKADLPNKISKQSNNIILDLQDFNWANGKYRLYIIPTDTKNNSGQGKNILFEVNNNNPLITLNKPYNKRPYTGKITSNPYQPFEGIISTDNLLKSELFINNQLNKESNQKVFRIIPEIENGLNEFELISEKTDGYYTKIKGDLTLDTEGPEPEIIIE